MKDGAVTLAMVRCPSCGQQQEPSLLCAGCGAPLPVSLDYFAALGLAHKLVIDSSALERTYHELGRRIHPDRFATSPSKVRQASLAAMALLTRGYRTLRDPVSRGLYWLELNGEKLAESNRQVPTDLVELVFEVQEQLACLRASAGRELMAEVSRRRSEVQEALERGFSDLERNFARWDEPSANKPELTAELKAVLSRIAYLRTLLRDIDRQLESAEAAAAPTSGGK